MIQFVLANGLGFGAGAVTVVSSQVAYALVKRALVAAKTQLKAFAVRAIAQAAQVAPVAVAEVKTVIVDATKAV